MLVLVLVLVLMLVLMVLVLVSNPRHRREEAATEVKGNRGRAMVMEKLMGAMGSQEESRVLLLKNMVDPQVRRWWWWRWCR